MKSLFFVLPALLLGLTACGAPVAAVTLPDCIYRCRSDACTEF